MKTGCREDTANLLGSSEQEYDAPSKKVISVTSKCRIRTQIRTTKRGRIQKTDGKLSDGFLYAGDSHR